MSVPARAPSPVNRWLIWVAVAMAAAAALAAGLSSGLGMSRLSLMAPIGLVAGLGLMWLAVTRFELFVAMVLVVRASLDAVKVSPTGTGIADPSSILSILFLAAGGIWLLAQRDEEGKAASSTFARPLFALGVAATLSVAFSVDPGKSAVELVRIITTIVIVLVLNRLLVDERRIKLVLGAIFLSLLVPLAMGALEFVTGSGLHYSGSFGRVESTFLHPNPLAMYLTLLMVMGFALLPRVAGVARNGLVALLLLSAVMLVLTYTRSGWIAALIGIAVVGALQSRRQTLLLCVAVAALIFLAPSISERFADLTEPPPASGTSGNSLTWRLQYWEETMGLARDPVLGAGLRTIEGSTAEAKLPHNDFVRVFVETGLLGLAAYAWLLITFIKAAIRSVRETNRGTFGRSVAVGFAGTTAAFLILSMVSNVLSQLVIFWYFLPMAMAAVAAARLQKRETAASP